MTHALSLLSIFVLILILILISTATADREIKITTKIRNCILTSIVASIVAPAMPAFASGTADSFDAANKLYYEGKFAEAAAAYEKLIQTGPPSAALYFNLGNAWFKAAQKGRAIAAYLRARRLDPREPGLRFNLRFVRQKVTGSEAPIGAPWQRALATLTLNEWTRLSAGALWLWFLLLALREVRPALRKTLRGYTAVAGAGTALFVGCLGAAAYEQTRVTTAVVTAPEAVVRRGPLDVAAVAWQLRDGSEVIVLDEKEITEQDKKQTWLQVQDAARRIGWLKREQVIICL